MEVQAALVSLRKMGLWPKGHGQITRCGWRGADGNYELRITNYELRITNYE